MVAREGDNRGARGDLHDHFHCDYPFARFGDEEQQFVERLDGLGAALWVGEPGWGRAEFTRPAGWQDLDCGGNEARLATFELLRSCICVNTGQQVGIVDVDVANGGDVEKVRALLKRLGVRVFAEVDTPGGGKHFYVEGHSDLILTHSRDDNEKLPGYPGVDILSFGANAFVPGTGRPKYGNRGYEIVYDELALLDEDDDGGTGALAGWVAGQRAEKIRDKARTTPGAAREWEWDPCGPWTGGRPDKRQRASLDAALHGEAEQVAGTGKGGRNDALFTAALKLGSYVAGAGLDEQQAVAALEAAAEANGYTAEDGLSATRASIRSGLRAGKTTPRAVPRPRLRRRRHG